MDILLLAKKGSLIITRPAYSTHVAVPAERDAACAELFDLVKQGVLKVESGTTYALKDAEQAHRDLEARKTVGSVVMIP